MANSLLNSPFSRRRRSLRRRLGPLADLRGQVHGPLSRVRVLGALVHLELPEQLVAQLPRGQHPAHGPLDDALRDPRLQLPKRLLLLPAGAARVPVVQLLVGLAPGDLDLLGVDDDDVGAGVHRGRVERAVLAPQHAGDERREPAERRALGVDDVPPLGALEGVPGPGVVGLVPEVCAEVGRGGDGGGGSDVGGRGDGD